MFAVQNSLNKRKLKKIFNENQQQMPSSDYIANLTDHLQQAVLAVDQSGVIVYCNDSASHFWQRGMELLLGRQNKDLFQADLLIQQKIREVLDSGKVFRIGGYVLQTPPLNERGAEIVIAPVRNESGIVDKALITLLESTAHQEFQARELEEKLSSSLGELAGAMAHEIQNPLSGIKGMLQLMQRELQSTKIKNNPVIISGIHRSGTSLLSKIFQNENIYFGSVKDINNESIFYFIS